LKKTHSIVFFFWALLFISSFCFAQKNEEPTDDLGNVSDAFQEHFFEALKQKGIENYELALEALKKAEKNLTRNKENALVIYFEMAKNQKELKQYHEAENNLQKILTVEKDKIDVIEELYDLYYLQKDYKKAIPVAQKLTQYDSDYKEDLANLYHRTKQYDKALQLLDELDESWGESRYRNILRKSIYKVTGNSEGAIENLESKINKNPKKEQDYLNLIYLYSEQGDTQKAFNAAKELIKNQPNSHLAHLALYKFYLNEGSIHKALESINIVFGSSAIEKKNKYTVLKDFLSFISNNPQHESKVDKISTLFSSEDTGHFYELMGNFYNSQNKKEKALLYFAKGASQDEDNFSLLKSTLLVQIDLGRYKEAVYLSKNALDIFPAQPLLYLINGVANNQTNQPDTALESLEAGIDFLLDNPKMEKDFYEQIAIAYTQKGNSKKANEFTKKATQINLPN